ncbi:hypothetical protein EauM23_00005 [Exiguobacterium phage vB_EauM-23]|nr:hypothetical protein EauM23_00005 [Exiguobacterium phage vB_EauM-23]
MKKLVSIQIHKFKYDSKEEREKHVKEMEAQGYECTGQIKHNDNYYNPKSKEYWYGEFFKHYQ